MKSITSDTFSKNNLATLSQPLRLVVVLVIVTVIIMVLSLSLENLIAESQVHQIEQQVQKILREASTMFEHADEGSTVILQVNFPATLRCIVFGHLPRTGTLEPVNTALDENSSNVGYYVMTDGTIRSFHSNARFSDNTMTQIAVFYQGTYAITLELCKLGGKTFVTLS